MNFDSEMTFRLLTEMSFFILKVTFLWYYFEIDAMWEGLERIKKEVNTCGRINHIDY